MSVVELPEINRVELARRYLESAENWIRKIIHHQLLSKHGPNYLGLEGIIKKEIISYVEQKKREKGKQITRDIDATTFDQVGSVARILIDNQLVGEALSLSFKIVTNRDWHRNHGYDDQLTTIFRVLPPPH